MRFCVVAHTADLFPHQRCEERIDKIQQRLATAEIIGKRDNATRWRWGEATDEPAREDARPTIWRDAPRAFVALKDRRISKAEAIDALLHIADEEAVRTRTFTTDGAENRVLRGVDVLILVHENVRQPLAPTQRDGRWRRGLRVPKQAQRELFKIGKVHASRLALGLSEGRTEIARQSQQRQHLMPRPFPILRERIKAVGCGRERVEEFRFRKTVIEDIAHFACVTVRPLCLERFCDGHECFSDLFQRRFGGQLAERRKTEFDILREGKRREPLYPTDATFGERFRKPRAP